MYDSVLYSLVTIILGLVTVHLFVVLIEMFIYKFKYHWTFIRYLNETSKPYIERSNYDNE